MTRAYKKLAVTIWGVMALSGCVTQRSSDKPNSSGNATHVRQAANQNKLMDSTAIAYARGVDSLQAALEKETIALMEEPVVVRPMALPVTAYTKFGLYGRTVKKINPTDSTAFTQNAETESAMIGFLRDTTYRYPILDCDEILYEARDDDYIQIPDQKKNDHLIAVHDIRALVDAYRGGNDNGKVYLGLRDISNAVNLPLPLKKIFGLRPDVPTAFVYMGLLKDYDADQLSATMRHERGHEGIEKRHQDFLLAHAQTRGKGDSLLQNYQQNYAFRRYLEYQADSTSYAVTNADGKYNHVPATDIPQISAFRYGYQRIKEKAAYTVMAITTPGTDTTTVSANEKEIYQEYGGTYEDARNFTPQPTATHDSHAKRIYYTIIHQRRAAELADNGKTILYQQYSDLLPQEPIVKPFEHQTPKTSRKGWRLF